MPEQRNADQATTTSISSKRQIEAGLHEKLETARIEYESASKDYKRALKHCDEARSTNSSDGNGNGHSRRASEPSTSQAIATQRHAFEKYRRALDEFNKFILYGDLPE
jgi:hypothetical protein